jgi:hypothetical protein
MACQQFVEFRCPSSQLGSRLDVPLVLERCLPRPQHLAERVPGQPEVPGDLLDRLSFDEVLALNPRNRLHDQHPLTTRFDSKWEACNGCPSGPTQGGPSQRPRRARRADANRMAHGECRRPSFRRVAQRRFQAEVRRLGIRSATPRPSTPAPLSPAKPCRPAARLSSALARSILRQLCWPAARGRFSVWRPAIRSTALS